MGNYYVEKYIMCQLQRDGKSQPTAKRRTKILRKVRMPERKKKEMVSEKNKFRSGLFFKAKGMQEKMAKE